MTVTKRETIYSIANTSFPCRYRRGNKPILSYKMTFFYIIFLTTNLQNGRFCFDIFIYCKSFLHIILCYQTMKLCNHNETTPESFAHFRGFYFLLFILKLHRCNFYLILLLKSFFSYIS